MRRRDFVQLLAQGAAMSLASGCLSASPAPEPGPASSPPANGPLTDDLIVKDPKLSALEARADELRDAHTRDGFNVVVSDPFVVVGDEDLITLRRRCSSTIAWATKRLQEAYFAASPPGPITIWLFRDAKSYRTWAWKLFKHRPDTPYGYYSPDVEALIMDISTGGGTLVHEMVHPFIDANFPSCPSWFDEGLASLYEACAERDGKIVGLVNWRLTGLQEAIIADDVPSFEALTSTSRDAFYDDDPGTHYAQARYLCFYLQERGLIRDYYRQFAANVASDPSGYATLKRVAKIDDIAVFERDWRTFVQGLRLG